MWRGFLSLLKKDFQLMWSSKFLLLAFGSLVLYSCYINFLYVNLDQDIYPVYLYDPLSVQQELSADIVRVDSLEELNTKSGDGYAVGIDMSSGTPQVTMVSSNIQKTDNYRAAYALSLLSPSNQTVSEITGKDNKEMKSRREITCEFLFFELAAVGFLGIASMLFKEKQMGVVRIHGVLPISKTAFMLSKLSLFLLSDLVFSTFLTVINLGALEGLLVLPYVLAQTAILSLIMALVGFFCAVQLPDFKQFSLLYLVLAVFITTPVFLVGQTGIAWSWITYHPMYHLFMAMKNAYRGMPSANGVYYTICGLTIILLFLLVRQALIREMAKEG
ncbi:MAG: ABC transporter permease [Lachnospiraceae bacterium]|nr:ABC transporter permease [Lachnospiraceae bacterium]